MLSQYLPASTSDILGKEDINALLLRHSRVELRHFKLWTSSAAVLSRVIHSGLWNRTEELLESIESRARFYVLTDHLGRTMDTLEQHNVCVITGPPGVGKSILAEMVLLAHSKEAWQVVQISEDVKEGFSLWNPEHPQIFYYDDFLGQTDLAETTGKNEDHRIAQFSEMVRKAKPGTKRFVLTTREQVFRHAQERSDRIRRAKLALVPTEVRVEDYSDYVKASIFYNHLYFSDLPESDRRTLVADRSYLEIIGHQNYSPRILEQTLRYHSRDLDSLLSSLRSSLDSPEELWSSSYHHLSSAGRKILSILTTFPPRGADESGLRKHARPRDPHEYMQALKVLEGTWVTISSPSEYAGQRVALANPSCRDFLLHSINSSAAMAESVLSDVRDVRQVLMALRYSGLDMFQESRAGQEISLAWDKPKDQRTVQGFRDGVIRPSVKVNEGLRAALLEEPADFIQRIRRLYVDRVVEWKKEVRKDRGGFRMATPDPRPEILSAIIHFVMEHGESSEISWCRSEVEAQVSAERGLPVGKVESYVTLAVSLQAYEFGTQGLIEGILERALAEFYDPADVGLFFDVFDPQGFSEEMHDAVCAAFNEFAEGERDHWRTENEYEQSRSAADFVESIARKLDVSLQEMLETWRQSIDEDEAENDSSQRYADSPRSGPSSDVNTGSGSRIAELFSTLVEG